MSVSIVVHSLRTFDTEVDNPLGDDGVPHRMWTWPDGNWLMIRFYDDGAIKASTSPGLAVSLSSDDEGVVHAAVSPVRRALQRSSTRENELM